MKTYFRLIFLLCILALSCFSRSDDDPLHKRKFNSGLTETRNGVVAKKMIADLFEFKNGKLYSDYLHKKFGFGWIRYRINKDSIYTDETNTEVRLLEVEAVQTDENNQTVQMEFTVLEWDLDGTIRITRNDRLKRFYDLVGREKGGKPKKEKKKKENPVFELITS